MAQLIVRRRNGEESTIEGVTGYSVMEILRRNGFNELLALCGGSCSCATCHVYVDSAWLGRLAPIGAMEEDLLETSVHRLPQSRLSCQIEFRDELDGLKLSIAPEE